MGIENVPDKMLACQIMQFKEPYKIHEIPTPKDLQPHELLIKVAVAGLCHTDGMVQDGIMGTKLPCTASHEGTGTVAAVGSNVKGFKEGDRVMCGIFKDFCGVCKECQGPEPFRQYCGNNGGGIGVHTDGCFADYVVCDSRTSALLPDKISFQTAAPLACAGITVFRGVLNTQAKAGQWIAIVGSGGGLGHLGIQFAKAKGLKVVGIDARDPGLKLSKDCGADLVVDARKGNDALVEEINRVTNSEGVEATINVSDAKSAAATACAITRKHGLMVQIAQPETVDIPFFQLVFRDVRVHGSLISSPQEAQQMMDIVAEHNISVRCNPVNGIKEVPKLLELAHGGQMQGKGICIIDQAQIDKQRKDAV